MTTLAEWLLAQIAEDEAAALKDEVMDRGFHSGACELLWVADYLDPECTCNMRERVLAGCEAKRRRLEALDDLEGEAEESEWRWISRHADRLRTLEALPYADRPGYDEAWRP